MKSIRKIFYSNKNACNADILNPEKDWFIALVLFGLSIILILYFSYSSYISVYREDMFIGASDSSSYSDRLNIDQLRSVTDYFDSKEIKNADLKKTSQFNK